MSGDGLGVIEAAWPAPPGVVAFTTLRAGGVSRGPYAGLNLATHVGDDAHAVRENRARLVRARALPAEPVWLDQVHGTRVVDAARGAAQADGVVARAPGVVCAVLTADCLPVFLCDRRARAVGLAHAGWRGLAAGVVERTVAALGVEAADVLAWLGPAIGPAAFEVGEEVRAEFVNADATSESAFRRTRPDHYHADLYALARRRLQRAGVTQIFGGGHCTFSDPARFYSYRRERVCGRMASVVWIARSE